LSVRSIPDAVAVRHFSIATQLWPERAGGFSGVLRAIILIALGRRWCPRSDACSIGADNRSRAKVTPLTPLAQLILGVCG